MAKTSPIKTTPKKSTKPKKMVLKKKVIKVKSVVKPTVKKTVVVASKSVRKVNNKPVLADTTGINVSPAKVKNIISNHVLNKKAYDTICAIKEAMPQPAKPAVLEVKDNKGNVTQKAKKACVATAGTPVNKLPVEIVAYVTYAKSEYECNQKKETARTFIHGMTSDVRAKYTNAKHDAKVLYEQTDVEFLKTDEFKFNCEKFNLSFNKTFYAAHKNLSTDKSDSEWKRAIGYVTKLKNRFSTNSRVFLAAFSEYVIKQLVTNGTVSCIANGKRIIQLSHALDITTNGFEKRFPLYSLITNLDTFKQAHKYINKSSENVVEKKTDDSKETTKTSKDTDIFHLEGISLERRYQFRYYISETCREVRMKLAKEETDDAGKPMDVYNLTSVSKLFKNFCSTLICELLMRIGTMLKCEIKTRGIKTVNDTIISTVLSHYHIVCGVDETDTTAFIKNVTKKYYTFTKARQVSRKKTKTENLAVGDMKYVKE
jgi:hypothetical protein